jgi:hypothetical protein
MDSRGVIEVRLHNAVSDLSKYATDQRGQKDQRSGQEQSGNNPFP